MERYFNSSNMGIHTISSSKFYANPSAIHVIGNGRTIGYSRGPEIVQLFGPTYSSPNIISMSTAANEHIICKSKRVSDTGIWRHELKRGYIEDCAPHSPSCFIRHWELDQPVKFRLDVSDFKCSNISSIFHNCMAYLVNVPAGSFIYGRYPLQREQYNIFMLRGDYHLNPIGNGFELTMHGNGEFIFCGGLDMPECINSAKAALVASWSDSRAASVAEGAAFQRRRLSNQPKLSDHPIAQRIFNAAEEVSWMICAQQDENGGFAAGYNYHLAYVRDQYGISRGLLAIGCWEEAKKILRYYINVFNRYGRINNAQDIGITGIFHMHENECSEITGYIVRQTLDMLSITGDEALFEELIPMVNWAIELQATNIIKGMLPFNGDETYIAGGILPRTAINYGSFEATLLFINSTKEYLSELKKRGRVHPASESVMAAFSEAEMLFVNNFKREDNWIANSELRMQAVDEPEYRHGLCMGCSTSFGWLKRSARGFYICPECIEKGIGSTDTFEKEHVLSCTSIVAPYLSIDFEPDFIKHEVERILSNFRKNGVLISRTDGNSCPGYEYGLALCAAAKFNLNADDLAVYTLDIQDASGSWSEYYTNGKVRGSQCRPWDSGVNIAGLIKYAVTRWPESE